jgi:Na+-transporting NADH:ubiquinone oxidoreductase subunit B
MIGFSRIVNERSEAPVPTKPTKVINWQLPMQRVLYALVPIIIASVYFFGWRALVLIGVANVAGFISEAAFTRKAGQPVTSAVFVTSTLFALSLPPLLPLGMVVVGIVFGVVFGKMVFGGFGKNIFNPALVGRAFIYISFGDYMTARCWTHPIAGLLGGLTSYANSASDAITQATPTTWLKPVNLMMDRMPVELFSGEKLILGNTAGCIGGTSALLVLLGGLYLIKTKAANYRAVISMLLGFVGMQAALHMAGISTASNPVQALLAGSVLFGAFFYVTDPVSAPKTQEGRWLYGAIIGMLSSLIQVFTVWPEGTMFAILLGNMFAPITDYAIKSVKAKTKAKAA